MDSVPSQDEASIQEDPSSEQEIDPKVIVNPSHAFPSMFMPYIESPKMDWSVNGGLYSRFLKCKLKCQNILVCELAMLAEKRKSRRLLPGVWTLGLINICLGI